MSESEVYNYLNSIGCCDLCILRYLKGRNEEYVDASDALIQRGITLFDKTSNDDSDVKRKKPNYCISCLELLNRDVIENTIRNIVHHKNLENYHCETIFTSISIPISLHLRQLSIWIHLLEKFPNKYSLSEPPDVHLKEVIKLLINPIICLQTNKKFEQNQNGLLVNVVYEYDDDDVELEKLKEFNPSFFHNRSHRKYRKEFITRNAFEKYFTPNQIDIKLYKNYINVPPSLPNTAIKLKNITITGPTVFIAGRYRKISRELSQTPWILNGVRLMKSSVQEIILEQVAPYFKKKNTEEKTNIDNIVFMSSGREDVDVRCLGKGRPFVLEIQDSYRTTISQKCAAEIENKIDLSEKVSVQYLQIIQRDDVNQIKIGEETKKKWYRALCILNESVTVDTLKKLNISEEFLIQQMTPLRVLHRRPLHTRPRYIYSIETKVHPDNHNLLIMDIVTQAGTYVKELIHGDFGRTSPSIKSIIDKWIDIIALDVINIDLKFPIEIDNKKVI